MTANSDTLVKKVGVTVNCTSNWRELTAGHCLSPPSANLDSDVN